MNEISVQNKKKKGKNKFKLTFQIPWEQAKNKKMPQTKLKTGSLMKVVNPAGQLPLYKPAAVAIAVATADLYFAWVVPFDTISLNL